MPHWKALPEELDPHIREFASQLSLIVERSGLNTTALADRTGFDETSWERYLSGRNLPPRRAVVALADATGTPQHHLTAMWELAERVHSFDAYGSDPYRPDPYGSGLHRPDPHDSDPHRTDGRAPFVPSRRGTVPPVPQQRQGGPQADARRGGGVSGRAAGGRSNAITLAVGAAGAVIVIVGALMLAPSGDEPAKAAPPAPTAAPTSEAPTEEPAPEPPAGVECQGADCAGQNPDEMGCGGDHARTVSTAQVGTARVEVRYSEVCSAAWARLTEAGTGDTVTITGGAAADAQNGAVTVTEAYTPMVAVRKAADAKACATLTAGTKGCTT
ncbi:MULTISPECIES: helix-turn-helix domain-containing protein [Streptomyces]|uniref:helix-turn-helix domain-containing protein n=1 Tax=Streptomyces TaxID=1883 RepID=UPI0004C7D7EF|nr:MULTISPECIES: XRE family transcriptional regulator [Streptomyces]CAD5954324.1 XRE family transcriptional regulator [Streptomyces sp. KY70]CAD5982736.1 XRE family transcriptional regulator [Streptomyces sp. KY75]